MRKIMRKAVINKLSFLVLFSLLCIVELRAQDGDPLVDNWPDMQQVKKMMTIKWEPAGKNIRIFLTGYEAAKLEFNDLNIEVVGESSLVNPELGVRKEKDSFLVNNANDLGKIKVKVKVKDKNAFDYDLRLR